MNWHFCPHCETQLDEETFICPACRWDPLTVETPEPEQKTSLIERYRGTEYDNLAAEGAMAVQARTSTISNRARAIVMIGLLAIVGLYGTMMVYSDFRAHQDHPASMAGAQR